MARYTIYFWEPCLSPHKLALFRALKAHPDIDGCTYVTQAGLPEERAAQGWEVGATDDIDLRVAPDRAGVEDIVANAPANAFHLFSGIHWVPCIVDGLRAAIAARSRFAIMTEPRVREGFKGLLRLAHSWATEGSIRRSTCCILAIGRNGPRWFRRAGYRRDRIFPFAYFLPIPPIVAPATRSPVPTVAYLGRLNHPKGIQLFVQAMDRLDRDVAVEIAGAGPDVASVRQWVARAPERRVYHGAIPMPEVPAFLARTDILVVPSITTDDGWGAVVSEALMNGAAVVATAQVGASICLDQPWRGAVVNTLDPADVAEGVRTVCSARSQAARDRRSAWARDHLSGEAGAAYLLDVLAHLFDGAARPRPFYDD